MKMYKIFYLTISVILSVFCFVSSSSVLENGPNLVSEEFDVRLEDLGPLDKEKKLYIYTWFDQISPNVIDAFFKLTGIRVITDVFDSNETLEAKLLTGSCSYDIVLPTAWPFFYHQMQAKVFRKLDSKRLSKYKKKFDKYVLSLLKDIDPLNEYSLPFAWGINGIGINIETINLIAPDMPLDSWGILFDPKYAKKLKIGKISLLESPEELFSAIFSYLGLSLNDLDINKANQAIQCLKEVREFVSKFDSYSFQDLANGGACAVMCSSGDLMFARSQTSKKNARNLRFIIPKEGACLWVDLMAIPKNAKHFNNAHAFIIFLSHPKVSAQVTEYSGCASALPEAKKYISKEISDDSTIYPSKEVLDKCHKGVLPRDVSSYISRALTRIKSGMK